LRVPIIFGLPLHFWLGLALFILIVFQVLTGRRVIKLSFNWHRIMGYTILVLAAIHATIASGLLFGIFRY
jgi:hypothetical protein